jgi:hypothetical protein
MGHPTTAGLALARQRSMAEFFPPGLWSVFPMREAVIVSLMASNYQATHPVRIRPHSSQTAHPEGTSSSRVAEPTLTRFPTTTADDSRILHPPHSVSDAPRLLVLDNNMTSFAAHETGVRTLRFVPDSLASFHVDNERYRHPPNQVCVSDSVPLDNLLISTSRILR